MFKLFGIVGLVLICMGILVKNRGQQDLFYVVGGIGMLIYSIYLSDVIFICLQIVFTLSATYDLIKRTRRR